MTYCAQKKKVFVDSKKKRIRGNVGIGLSYQHHCVQHDKFCAWSIDFRNQSDSHFSFFHVDSFVVFDII